MPSRRRSHIPLDAQSLRLFLAIYDTGSVTGAAEVLQINQSSASHGLEKLRKIFDNPLFAKSGRRIVPTDHVEKLVPRIRSILSDMTGLLETGDFDPAMERKPVVIATNSYIRLDIVHGILDNNNLKKIKNIALNFIELGASENIEHVINNNNVDLILAISRMEYTDFICSERLFSHKCVVYYDPKCGIAPDTLEKYCSAPHAIVDFGTNYESLIDVALNHHRLSRSIRLRVPSIEALPRLLMGTELIATMPEKLSHQLFSNLAHCQPPLSVPPYSVDMIWHLRSDNSPRNQWLRGLVATALQQKQ